MIPLLFHSAYFLPCPSRQVQYQSIETCNRYPMLYICSTRRKKMKTHRCCARFTLVPLEISHRYIVEWPRSHHERRIYPWNRRLERLSACLQHLEIIGRWTGKCIAGWLSEPYRTVNEPRRQTSATRKKQNVGHRRPHLEGLRWASSIFTARSYL